jgi:hypothetical protein
MGNRERKGILMNQDELEFFKTKIDMRQFAVSLGCQIDRRESWRGSTVLRRGAGRSSSSATAMAIMFSSR